jgi:hypothetical protein
VYVNDIWRNIESIIRLLAGECIINRKSINNKDVEMLQIDLKKLGELTVENAVIINPAKSKAVFYMRVRLTDPISYSLRDSNSGSELL